MEQKGSSHKRRRPGRPVGDSCTRDAILDASLEMFAANGYDGASVRAIAERAGVDPGLIRHFFSDKAGLFMATMADRTQISQKIAGSLHGDPSSVGERLADTYLALWEDEETRPVLLALARSATSSERAAALLLDVMKARLGDGQSGSMTVGMALASSHLFGVAMARYVLHAPPLVGLSHDELVRAIAPTLQAYLTESASL